MYKFFDIHSHLHFKGFDDDRDLVILEMQNRGIGSVTIGTDYEDSKKAILLAEKYENIYASVGFHPANGKEFFSAEGGLAFGWEYEKFLELAKHPKVVTIGECGIDYFYLDKNLLQRTKEDQHQMFREHVRLAVEVDKPLMLHIRPSKGMDAYIDVIEILKQKKEKYGDKVRGNFHFFVGDVAVTQKILDLGGFTVSFSGVITFAKEYEEVVRFMPIDMIHAETDSPYVSPIQNRGKRNSPLNVKHIVEKIAEIKGMDVEEVKEQLKKNAEREFGINFG